MLVLSRKEGESILIGPLPDGRVITVRVQGFRRDQVKLSFEAPTSIPIHREEIYRAIAEERRRAEGIRQNGEPESALAVVAP